ncbi:MAG: ECF-type sigma factor [Isosphaeraceae bacterium]
MGDDGEFAEFWRRVRQGDEAAAEELVERFGAALRLEIRMNMHDPRLKRVIDLEDVCQSVLGSFFVRAASGQFDLERPEQLAGLLMAMGRNKVAMQARRQRTQSRDVRRELAVDGNALALPSADPSPSRLAAGRELLSEFRRRLGDEERQLAELRARGLGWAEIASEVGGTPQARRKQLARAADRVARELGLAEVDDDA